MGSDDRDGQGRQGALVAQVKAEMAVLGIKQKDMAAKTGMQSSTLSRYLSGQRDIPLPVMFAFTDALNLPFLKLAQRAERRLSGRHVQ